MAFGIQIIGIKTIKIRLQQKIMQINHGNPSSLNAYMIGELQILQQFKLLRY